MKKINDILLDIPLENRGISSIYNNMKKCGYIEPQVFYKSGIYEVTLFKCAGHGTNLTGESPVTGIYRQV